MDRKEQYNLMLEEDNTMLIEDNEIMRNKFTSLIKLIDSEMIEVTTNLHECVKVSQDYFIGQKWILTKIKKELSK